MLHDKSSQAVIDALHKIDEGDYREDVSIKQTRFPQNSERKKTNLSKEELGGGSKSCPGSGSACLESKKLPTLLNFTGTF